MTFTISVFEIMLFYAALNIVIILLNVVDVVDVPSILNTFAHLIFITFQ